MVRFRLDEARWPLYQAVGSWTAAMVLSLYEGFVRHFQDQGGYVFIGMLLGLPIVVGVERQRRNRERDAD